VIKDDALMIFFEMRQLVEPNSGISTCTMREDYRRTFSMSFKVNICSF